MVGFLLKRAFAVVQEVLKIVTLQSCNGMVSESTIYQLSRQFSITLFVLVFEFFFH